MKQKAILCLLLFLIPWAAMAQEIVNSNFTVTYVDGTGDYPSAPLQRHGQTRLIQRYETDYDKTVCSRQNKLKAYVAGSALISPSALRSLRMAMDLWEERLNISTPVSFDLIFTEDLPEDVDAVTTVGYSADFATKTAVPESLYMQDFNVGEYAMRNTITININTDWDLTWLYNQVSYPGTVNLLTVLQRQLGRILGFGTSLAEGKTGTAFSVSRFPSAFDNMVVGNDGRKLGDLCGQPSDDIRSFMAQGLSLKLPGGDIALYSSQQGYEPSRSGCFFAQTENDKLMAYPGDSRERLLTIDAATIEALAAIGWDVKPYGVQVRFDGLDKAGYGSAYSAHTVQAVDQTGTPLNAQWTYQLYDNRTRQYTTHHTATGSTLAIPTDAPNEAFVDSFAFVQGRVACSVDGVEYAYPVFLEAQPIFLNYQLSNLQETDNEYYYSMDITLFFQGAQSGEIWVNSHIFPINGENQCTVHTSSLFKYDKTVLMILLYNDFGEGFSYLTLGTFEELKAKELPSAPTDESTNKTNVRYAINGNTCEIESPQPLQSVIIVDYRGHIEYTARDIRETAVTLEKGLYILITVDADGKKETNKIVIL